MHTSGNGTTVHVDWWYKPIGRGRRFDRLAHALARRLRIPFVRRVRWERMQPDNAGVVYGPMWTSDHALANFSFACECHKNERYSRKRGR